ncbi:hypothetical protein NQ317_017849, partial [Molorchus minor]
YPDTSPPPLLVLELAHLICVGLYSDQGLPSGASCRVSRLNTSPVGVSCHGCGFLQIMFGRQDCDDTYPLVGFYLPMFPFFILGREINWML